jgi:predicted ATPase
VHDVFVGREEELATLRAVFADVRREGARTVVIEGEAGIGKSALVEHFLGELEGVPRLRASGDESESHVRFALADQLLRPSGGSAIGAAQHVAVGMELLEVMTSVGGVVVVDDAHLADADSLRALLFAARRLAQSPVLVLLTVRDERLRADDAAGRPAAARAHPGQPAARPRRAPGSARRRPLAP